MNLTLWIWLLLPLIGVGCQRLEEMNHVTPQINGRVLDAVTRQPLAGVTVQPVLPGQLPLEPSQEKGAQRLVRGRPMVTDAGGWFVVSSRSFVAWRQQASGSGPISFSRFGYYTLQTNFVSGPAVSFLTNGVPRLDAGNILLQPLRK